MGKKMKKFSGKESDLYEPMRLWLDQKLRDKYKNGYEIITMDASQIYLDKALSKHNIKSDVANGLNIQIDVLGIVKKEKSVKLFFIEAKKESFTIRDLGQLWAYCKLIDPEEAYLLTTETFGQLKKPLLDFNRMDMLDFGDGRKIKQMHVGIWNVSTNSVDFQTLIPKT